MTAVSGDGYDIVILGGGSGRYACAPRTSELGSRRDRRYAERSTSTNRAVVSPISSGMSS
jgi:hypothetical protein